MTDRPLVSVVMAVRNGGPWLAEALRSIEAQTYGRHETIVVDGHSTDGSREVAARHPGVRCLEQVGDGGFCGAWNEGLAAARGDLFAFLDSDDRWEPDKLALHTDLLRRRPEVDIALGRVRFFLEPEVPAPAGFRTHLLEDEHVAPMPGVLLARRAVLERIGDFDTSFGLSSDIEWFARVKDAGLVTEPVSALVLHKRVHDHNLSLSSASEYNEQVLRLARESALRMRSGA